MPRDAQSPAGDRAMRDGKRVTEAAVPAMKTSVVGTDFNITGADPVREAAYQVIVDENPALDDLARTAINRAFMAGSIVDDPAIPANRRAAYAAIHEATSARLIERCRAYEMVLRTTPVDELPELQAQQEPKRSKKRQPKRRAVRNA